MSEAPVFYDHHNHSFCVDASCECGVMISGYVQHLRSRLAAGDAEIERLQHSNDSIHLAASTNAADYAREKARAEKLVAALREIQEGKGPFDRDNHKFACNVIESMKAIAALALADGEEK